MKSSTLGIAVACLFVLGGGFWLFSDDCSQPQTRVSNTASDGISEPGMTILGQSADVVPATPARLSDEAMRRKVNPLRNPLPRQSTQQPIRPVSDVRENDRSHLVPRNESGSSLSGFGNPVDPFGSPQDNFLESAGFPGESNAPRALEPQPLPPAPSNASGNSFSNAATGQQQFPPLERDQSGSDKLPNNTQTNPLSTTQIDTQTNSSGQSLGFANPFGDRPSQRPVLSAPVNEPVATNHRAVPARQSSTQQFNTPVSGDEGTGTPGPVALEGIQTPHLTLEKMLPQEIVAEQPTTIKLLVKNVGRSTARDVTIRDRVPQGTRLLSTSPEATMSTDGELVWSLGHLDGGESLNVEMRIVPLREGEIGSVASVGYSAEVSSRKLVTRPKLQVEVKGPQEIRLGEIAHLEIIISNPGTATATGVVLEEYVPDGLYHKDGKILVNKNVDTLKPREAKKLTLPLTCTGNGVLVNRIVVTANGGLRAEEKTTVRALSPILELDIVGARQRFLERQSEYKLIVANAGTTSAQNVDLKLTLPTAVKFVSTNQSGVYEPSTHTVHWALEELPAQESGEIDLVVLPSKIGNYSMKFTGDGENNLKAEKTQALVIDGLAALSFEVTGQSLVEAGREATYEIRVTNKGTKSASNVTIRANLSDGMTFTRADGPTRHQTQNGVVQFDELSQLEPKGEKTYKIAAKCLSDGDHRVSVQVLSDELRAPITKEESTRVFK